MRAWARRNRAEFVTLVVLVVLAVGGGGGYLAYRAVSAAQIKAAADQYREDHSYRFQAGDSIKLDSDEDEPGREQGFSAGFGWKGTMVATVGEPQSFDSLADAGATAGRRLDGGSLSGDDSSMYQGAPVRYVACDVRLENVDAVQNYPVEELKGDADYAFSCDIFKLFSTDSDDDRFLQSPVWFDGAMPDAPPKWGGSFVLKPGDERTLRMVYVVPKSVPTDHLALRIGATGDDKYVVEFGGWQPQA